MNAKFRILFLPLMLFVQPSYGNGSELLQWCIEAEKVIEGRSPANDLHPGMCMGFVYGTRNQMEMHKNFLPSHMRMCLPERGITNQQAIRVLIKYLREHPETLHIHESVLAAKAFVKAYPCN